MLVPPPGYYGKIGSQEEVFAESGKIPRKYAFFGPHVGVLCPLTYEPPCQAGFQALLTMLRSRCRSELFEKRRGLLNICTTHAPQVSRGT